MLRKPISFTVIFLSCLTANTSLASIIVPAGLNPGDVYYLSFVTDGKRDGTSNSIADYNQFVRDEAVRSGAITENYGIDWFAIASAGNVAARDNAFVDGDIKVFLLNGTTKIADGFNDLWNTNIDSRLNLTQFGNTVGGFNPFNIGVWTGTNPIGGPSLSSGNRKLGTATPSFGSTTKTNFEWISDAFVAKNTDLRLYALSEKLTVPTGEVPEPASVVLWLGIACVVGVGTHLRRRKRKAA